MNDEINDTYTEKQTTKILLEYLDYIFAKFKASSQEFTTDCEEGWDIVGCLRVIHHCPLMDSSLRATFSASLLTLTKKAERIRSENADFILRHKPLKFYWEIGSKQKLWEEENEDDICS